MVEQRFSSDDWVRGGISLMLVFIGIAVLVSVLSGGAITLGSVIQGVWSLFGTIIGIFFLLWVFSWIFGWGWLGPRRRWHHRVWMHGGYEEILKERYASGEINKREYEEMRRDLRE